MQIDYSPEETAKNKAMSQKPCADYLLLTGAFAFLIIRVVQIVGAAIGEFRRATVIDSKIKTEPTIKKRVAGIEAYAFSGFARFGGIDSRDKAGDPLHKGIVRPFSKNRETYRPSPYSIPVNEPLNHGDIRE